MPTTLRPSRRRSLSSTQEIIVVIAFSMCGLLLSGVAAATAPMSTLAYTF